MKTYNVQLTKDEIDHIMTSFDMFATAGLRKDGVQLEDSINTKLALALQSDGIDNEIETVDIEFEDLDDMTIEDEVYPDGDE